MRWFRRSSLLSPPTPPFRHGPGVANLSVVMYYTTVFCFFGHLSFVALFLWLGVKPLVAFNIFSCAIFLFCFWINRRGHSSSALLLTTAEVAIHAALAVVCIGWDSGFHYYILGLLPLIFYSVELRVPLKLGLAFLMTGFYIGLYFYAFLNATMLVIDQNQLHLIGAVNILSFSLALIGLAYSYRHAATVAEKGLYQVNQKLEIQAMTDPLTGLFNRRIMLESLEAARDAYIVNGVPFSIILSDIDNFKLINDLYGHEIGDMVLKQVAEIMRQMLRGKDLVARWGGEEFLVLVTDGNAKDACQIAERLRVNIANNPIQTSAGPREVTITLGVTEYAGESDLARCINRADDAMYEGKRQGRNCVILSGHPS